jgi:hypothetical protein
VADLKQILSGFRHDRQIIRAATVDGSGFDQLAYSLKIGRTE